MAQSTQQRALLKSNLQMPLVVRDLLVTSLPAASDTTYALHEMMSNYSPDQALLCAAFVVKEIASFETMATNDLEFLHMECERLIERYSARDDLANDNPDLWNETQANMMHDIAEDIEGFMDLIALCHMSFEVTAPKIAEILNILSIQLQSSLMIVDEVISLQDHITDSLKNAPLPETTGYEADNVIRFPG